MIVKKNTTAMNDLQQQSRFALAKLDNLLSTDMPKGTVTNFGPTPNNPSPNTKSQHQITGRSNYESSIAPLANRDISLMVCASAQRINQLVYSLSGTCGNTDNQILATNVSIFTVLLLKDPQYGNNYQRELIGIRLKLIDANGPNEVDAIIKVIPGGA
jgi:hypothetical protein